MSAPTTRCGGVTMIVASPDDGDFLALCEDAPDGGCGFRADLFSWALSDADIREAWRMHAAHADRVAAADVVYGTAGPA